MNFYSLFYFLFSAIGNENILLNVKIGFDFLRETETMKQVQFSFQGSEDPTPGYKRCENQCKHKYVIFSPKYRTKGHEQVYFDN